MIEPTVYASCDECQTLPPHIRNSQDGDDGDDEHDDRGAYQSDPTQQPKKKKKSRRQQQQSSTAAGPMTRAKTIIFKNKADE